MSKSKIFGGVGLASILCAAGWMFWTPAQVPVVALNTTGKPVLQEITNANVRVERRFEYLQFGSSRTASLEIGDFNSDGSPDIFAAKVQQGSTLYRGPFEFSFDGNTGVRATAQGGSQNYDFYSGHVINDTASGDVDGDADPDLYVVNSSDPNQLYIATPTGLAEQIISADNNVAGFNRNAYIADLESDGDLDIITNRKMYRNDGAGNGAGSFTYAGFIGGGLSGSNDTFPTDIDGDGLLDFIASGRVNNDLDVTEILRNNGDDTFTAQTLFEQGRSDLDVADFNGDGLEDYFFSIHNTQDTAKVNRLFLNDGQGGVSEATRNFGYGSGSEAVTGDFDLNGEVDVVFATGRNSGFSYYGTGDGVLGDGPGATFGRVPSTANMPVTADMQVADFDLDGDLDVFGGGQINLDNNPGNDNYFLVNNLELVVTHPEETTVVGDLAGVALETDQTLTYTIVGGADQDLFTLDSQTGRLEFKEAVDYEAVYDARTNPSPHYQVRVQASVVGSPELQTTRNVRVNIQNTREPQPATVQFAPAQAAVSEDAGEITLSVEVGGSDLSSRAAQSLTLEVDQTQTTASQSAYTFESPLTLEVPASDYTTAQTFEVPLSIADNQSLDGERKIVLDLTNPSQYLQLGSARSLEITLNDNEVAGIAVSETAVLVVTEGEAAGRFEVALTAQPVEPVFVTVESSQAGLTLEPTRLEFNAQNWDATQPVSVLAESDEDVRGNEFEVTFAVDTVASDSDFAEAPVQTRRVQTIDPDVLEVVPSVDNLTLNEGEEATFTLVLSNQPDTEVTLILASDNSLEISPTQLIFNSQNWSLPQTVTVRAPLDENTLDEDTQITMSGVGEEDLSLPVRITDASPDSDQDGVLDDAENAGPNAGDGNADGTPDALQPDVVTVAYGDAGQLVLDTNGCAFVKTGLVFEANLTPTDEAYDYPDGLVTFESNCPEARIDLYVYGQVEGTLRKFAGGVYQSLDVEPVQVTLENETARKFSYLVTDGGVLDDSLAGDGIIRDPVGFGVIAPVEEVEENRGDTGGSTKQEEPARTGPEKLLRTGGFDRR